MSGPSEKVEECIDHLLNMEEEILQELAQRDDDMPDRYRPKKTTWEEKKVPKVNLSEVPQFYSKKDMSNRQSQFNYGHFFTNFDNQKICVNTRQVFLISRLHLI